MALKTNYKDDILNVNENTERHYQMVNNSDGTVSLNDVTQYTQVGDTFGAKDINATNLAVNQLIENIGNISVVQNLDSDATDKVPSVSAVKNEFTNKLGGCWIDFTDADGNVTTEPYIHWLEEVAE